MSNNKIYRDCNASDVSAFYSLKIPIADIADYPIKPMGSLFYNIADASVYLSDGTNWVKIGGETPISSSSFVVATPSGLPEERILTGTSGEITIADGGPGGDIDVGLADSGVTAGDYIMVNITVDSKGRVTSANNGTASVVVMSPSGLPEERILTGDSDISVVDGGPGGNVTLSLSDTPVSGGSYIMADITVDAKGRVTSAEDGTASAVVMSPSGLPQERTLTGSSDITIADGGPGGNATLDLSATGVTLGSYNSANITVDSKGRITAASSSLTAGTNDRVARYNGTSGIQSSSWELVTSGNALRPVTDSTGVIGGTSNRFLNFFAMRGRFYSGTQYTELSRSSGGSTYNLFFPNAAGTVGQALRIASISGADVNLEWAA